MTATRRNSWPVYRDALGGRWMQVLEVTVCRVVGHRIYRDGLFEHICDRCGADVREVR